MTGYQSKRTAALDEEGMYLVHQTAHPKPAQQKTVAWIEKDMQCDDFDTDSVTCEKPARAADGWEWIPLYTAPPQRPWVDLTKEEKQECVNQSMYYTAWSSDVDLDTLIDVVTKLLKDKNT
jgi:hypothetical protein